MVRMTGRLVDYGFGLAVLAFGSWYALSDGISRSVALLLATLVPAAVIVTMLLVRRPPRPQAWWCALAALVLLTVDGVAWLVAVTTRDGPVASAPTSVVLLPLGYLGLLIASLLVLALIARGDGGKIADAMIISLGVAGLLWMFALYPTLLARGAPASERAYTLLVVLLISGTAGGIVRALVSAQKARGTLAYLLVAATAALVGNIGKIVSVDPTTGAANDWVGATWIVAYLATGAAAAHPSGAGLAAPGRTRAGRLTRGDLAFLGAALALNPAVAGIRELAGAPSDLLQLSFTSFLLVPLVLYRVSTLARLHEAAERNLVFQATHDDLTGLPNRRAVETRVRTVVEMAQTGEVPGAAVCFLDLNGFKQVNDEHGHAVGDALLVGVARRLRDAVRADDLVARFGGDEFVLVLTGDPDHLQTDAVSRIQEAVSRPFDLGVTTTHASVSIGTAVVRPGSRSTVEQLMSLADARMYSHKRRHRASPLPPGGHGRA